METATKELVVVDGVGNKPYKRIWALRFSPDSSRYTYRAETDTGALVVTDGVEGPEFCRVTSPEFSPDSEHVVYYDTCPDDTRPLVIDDRLICRNVNQAYAEAMGRAAYVAQGDYEEWVVTPDGAGPHFESIGVILFSPDGRHKVYSAKIRGDNRLIVWDGRQISLRPTGTFAYPQFSSDGRHLAYWRQQDGLWYLVFDGHISAGYTDRAWYSSPPGVTYAHGLRENADGSFEFVGVRNGNLYRVVIESRD